MLVNKSSLTLFCFFLAIAFSSFFKKIELFAGLGLISFLDELAILVGFFASSVKIRKVFFNRFKLFLVLFSIYITFSIISLVKNLGVRVDLITYQMVSELKLPMILFILCSQMSRLFLDDALRILKIILDSILFLSLPFVAFQVLMPEQYDIVFSAGGHFGDAYFGSLSFNRAAGFFWFTGEFAVVMAFLSASYMFLRTMFSPVGYIVRVFFAVFLLLLSFSRQEIFSFLVSISFVLYASAKKPIYFSFRKITFIFFNVSGLLLLVSFASLLFMDLNISNFENTSVARLVFYLRSFEIAVDYFPFGSGLGTFGGAAAEKFNSPIYYDYGMNVYWWYKENKFLTDTWYPHVLGEAGVIGALFYSFALLSLYFFCKRRGLRVENSNVGSLAKFSIVFLCVNSISSPNLADSVSLSFLLLPFGLMFARTDGECYGRN